MKLSRLQKSVNKAVEHCARNRINPDEVDVCIRTFMVGCDGPTPRTLIDEAIMGGDFDRGTFMIFTEKKLREIDLDEMAVLREKYEEFCCSTDEVRELKRRLRKYEKTTFQK